MALSIWVAGKPAAAVFALPRFHFLWKRGNDMRKAERRYAFFQNRDCERFPCHSGVPEADFNCLFCYCPLYTLGERCGGQFTYTERGIKSCAGCAFPHVREHYDAVLARFPELAELARRNSDGDRVKENK